MTTPRFIQIHTLHSYSAALLNRDDSGLAKRLPYGGVMRTRISSQCLKRHWRKAEDIHNVQNIEGAIESFRSRDLVTEKVIGPLREHDFGPKVVDVIEEAFQKLVYGKDAKDRGKRQPLLLGKPELDYLATEAAKLANLANGSEETAKKIAAGFGGKKNKQFKDNMEVLRKQNALNVGITSALFGRMITSDPSANIEAPIHVAHAFTVHQEESESDYFTAVNDLFEEGKNLYDPFPNKEEDRHFESTAVQHINDTELTSNLFYGYVVIDVPGLVSNLTGTDAKDWLGADTDRTMAAQVVHHLTHLIAEVSPGAKLGSTAPYGYAQMMLMEAGDRQPRSLSGAFRTPCVPKLDTAIGVLHDHLNKYDAAYATGEARRAMQFEGDPLTTHERLSLPALASWAQNIIAKGEAA